MKIAVRLSVLLFILLATVAQADEPSGLALARNHVRKALKGKPFVEVAYYPPREAPATTTLAADAKVDLYNKLRGRQKSENILITAEQIRSGPPFILCRYTYIIKDANGKDVQEDKIMKVTTSNGDAVMHQFTGVQESQIDAYRKSPKASLRMLAVAYDECTSGKIELGNKLAK